MRFTTPVIVGFTGAYDIEGSKYPWVDLMAAGSDGDPLRASIAQTYVPNGELAVGNNGVADLEIRKDRNGKLKLRLHGLASVKKTAAVAA